MEAAWSVIGPEGLKALQRPRRGPAEVANLGRFTPGRALGVDREQ
jgi:hypothetical protein